MALTFHTGPGNSKHQLRCEVNRLTAELYDSQEREKALAQELEAARTQLTARERELTVIYGGSFTARLRMLFNNSLTRLSRELSA